MHIKKREKLQDLRASNTQQCVPLPAASPPGTDQFIFCASMGDVPALAETFNDPEPHMLLWKQVLKNTEGFVTYYSYK